MASFVHTVGHLVYRFDSLKEVMAKASPARSGDYLAGVAASNDGERVAAQMALANIPLTHFLNEALIPYEDDEVTRLIIDTHDAQAFAPVSHLTVGGLRDWLLSEEANASSLRSLAPGYALWRDFPYEYDTRLAIDVINGGPLLGQWVDDPAANPGDLDAAARADEDAWREEREAVLLYGSD